MSTSIKVKNSNYGRLTVRDGSAVPISLVIPFCRGDFSLGPLPPILNEIVKIRARGKRVSEALGERVDPQVSFSAWLADLIGDTIAPTGSYVEGALAEFLAQQGAYANVIPTSGTGDGAPKTYDLIWDVFGTKILRGEPQMTVLMRDFYGTLSVQEAGEGNSISCSGEVWGSIDVTRGGNTITYAEMS